MNEAYLKAKARIECEFQGDLQNIEGAFEKRKLAVDRQKEETALIKIEDNSLWIKIISKIRRMLLKKEKA